MKQVSNLEWTTRHENMKHAFDNKLLKGFVEEFYRGKDEDHESV